VTRRRRWAALSLLALSLTLGLLGQFYFFHRPAFLWDGLVFEILAALSFWLSWRTVSQTRGDLVVVSSTGRLRGWLREQRGPILLTASGLILSALATVAALRRVWNQDTHVIVFLWLLALVASLLAAMWPASWPLRGRLNWKGEIGRVSREGWSEAATVLALTGLALLVRATALDRVPFTLGGDEGWHGLLARQVLRGELRHPFVMGYMSMPTFFYWPLSWSLWLVGDSVVGLRLPAALAGAATLPVFYLLVRRLWGQQTALLSSLFLATYDYHLHYSRLGANNIWDTFLAVLLFWLVEKGLAEDAEGGRRRYFILAGLVLGFGVYFYTGARLLPLLVIAYVAFYWFRNRTSPGPAERTELLGLDLVLLLLTFLIVAGPMLGFALAHPDDWNARVNQVGIFQSGWLAREPGLTGKTTVQILAEQFLRAAGGFHVFLDRTTWYGADRPLLGFAAGVLALFGMVWAGARVRERRHFLILLWFWSVIISGGMLTEGVPSSQRLVMAIPAVVLLVGIGLQQVVSLLLRLLAWRQGEASKRWLPGALMALLAVGNLSYYFIRYTPARLYGSQNGETATMIGQYLRSLGGGYHVYFSGAPRIYWNFGTMSFLAPAVTGEDIVEPLTAPPALSTEGGRSVWVLLPERAQELDWVLQAAPGGNVRRFSDEAGGLRFIAYEAPP